MKIFLKIDNSVFSSGFGVGPVIGRWSERQVWVGWVAG